MNVEVPNIFGGLKKKIWLIRRNIVCTWHLLMWRMKKTSGDDDSCIWTLRVEDWTN